MPGPVRVRFRCPHTRVDSADLGKDSPDLRKEWDEQATERLAVMGKDASSPTALAKMVKAVARRELFDVPPSAQWKPVLDARMGPHGVLEVYEVGTYYVLVECPVCGDTRKVVTDQVVV
jgi:hypothetical protein